MQRPYLFVTTALLFFAVTTACSASQPSSSAAQPLSMYIDHADGGKTGKRHSRNLLASLGTEGCHATLPDPASDIPPQLVFDSHPVSIVKKERPNYQLIARAKTLGGDITVRGAILVNASNGIHDLSALDGERISFVNKGSWSGYALPIQLLKQSGVTEQRDTFFIVKNHEGAVSMLLHGDVFAAATAEPLAKRWGEANNLSIVAVTNEVETGGWWMLKGLPGQQLRQCAQALSRLKRSQHRALPAWIDGFQNALRPTE